MMHQLTAVRDRPSGLVLPLLLRQAHQLEDKVDGSNQQSSSSTAPTSKADTSSSRGIGSSSRQHELRRADFLARSYSRDRQWTVDSIEQALQQTWEALASVQQQIQRGEETYYEESQVLSAGSNLFRGWDLFIDARLTGDGNGPNAGGSGPGGMGGGGGGNSALQSNLSSSLMGGAGTVSVRRMPADFRWASGSCADAARFCQLYKPMGRVQLSDVVTKPAASAPAQDVSASAQHGQDTAAQSQTNAVAVPVAASSTTTKDAVAPATNIATADDNILTNRSTTRPLPPNQPSVHESLPSSPSPLKKPEAATTDLDSGDGDPTLLLAASAMQVDNDSDEAAPNSSETTATVAAVAALDENESSVSSPEKKKSKGASTMGNGAPALYDSVSAAEAAASTTTPPMDKVDSSGASLASTTDSKRKERRPKRKRKPL